MEAKIGKFFESVGNFFTGGDSIPWCDRDIIAGWEREVEEANGSGEKKNESIMRLSWALVHSKQPEDVQRGIAMLEASLANGSSSLEKREKFYLLAVGFYRSGEFARSRQLLEQCLEIQPDWRQALTLKKTVEDRVAKDGVIGIGLTATAIGLLVGGVAAALARKARTEDVFMHTTFSWHISIICLGFRASISISALVMMALDRESSSVPSPTTEFRTTWPLPKQRKRKEKDDELRAAKICTLEAETLFVVVCYLCKVFRWVSKAPNNCFQERRKFDALALPLNVLPSHSIEFFQFNGEEYIK